MATFPLKGAEVSVGGFSTCVESGDIDFGELNMVETTCSTDLVKTYEPGTFEGASGSFTINDSTNLAEYTALYDSGENTTIIFTWPDTGDANVTVTGILTNITTPVGVDQSFAATISFTGVAALSFTA